MKIPNQLSHQTLNATACALVLKIHENHVAWPTESMVAAIVDEICFILHQEGSLELQRQIIDEEVEYLALGFVDARIRQRERL